ncbi:MAG TPA: HAMP domain-containing sensor histidine kinase [Thermomicrobiaceae bacterium]|nr:HAMP domain-containing sensor histidine kinase [Thermomicrobiaceae bacterium]
MEADGERVLILAPFGRDAALAAELLGRAGLRATVCADVDALAGEVAAGVGALLLTQEGLYPAAVVRLHRLLADQPLWSDLPLVVLVSPESGTRASAATVEDLARATNATFLERPIRGRTLVSAVTVALRARQRQYELREHLEARTRAEAAERQARGIAEEAVRVRDEFLASVAHDLKNPLGAIKGYAQLMQRQADRPGTLDGARLIQGLGRIDAMASRAVGQIDELLDLARLRADNSLPLNLGATDLVDLVRHVIADYQQTTTQHPIRIETALTELDGVWDRPRLERVLGNLVGNAIKYSPTGGEIVVEIARRACRGDEWAVLTVRDRGIGIPPEDLPGIFERFYRAGNAAGQSEGTGLGLASVRQIVEQHGGSVSATSTVGQGSAFTVRLPVLQAERLPGADADR